MLVVSSGSTGSAFLNNHTVSGGAILHYRYTLPESLAEDMKALGPPPGDDAPAGSLDRFAVDAFLKVGLPRIDPSVTVMWLSDLDSTAHDKGIGDPATVDVLRHVDAEIKRIEDGLKAAGVFDDFNIWVTSDHGFSTHTGAVALDTISEALRRRASRRLSANRGQRRRDLRAGRRSGDRLGDRRRLAADGGHRRNLHPRERAPVARRRRPGHAVVRRRAVGSRSIGPDPLLAGLDRW